MRFANHSEKFNVDVQHRKLGGEPRVMFCANRKIGAGEELFISYGKDFFK